MDVLDIYSYCKLLADGYTDVTLAVVRVGPDLAGVRRPSNSITKQAHCLSCFSIMDLKTFVYHFCFTCVWLTSEEFKTRIIPNSHKPKVHFKEHFKLKNNKKKTTTKAEIHL